MNHRRLLKPFTNTKVSGLRFFIVLIPSVSILRREGERNIEAEAFYKHSNCLVVVRGLCLVVVFKIEGETSCKTCLQSILSIDAIIRTMDEMPPIDTVDFTCPICRQFFNNASFIARCGHEYCQSCISRWLNKKCTCPTCRGPAFHEDIKPCYLIRSIFFKVESEQRNECEFLSSRLSDKERDTAIRLQKILKTLQG